LLFFDINVDNFIQLAIVTAKEQLEHVRAVVMRGIHIMFLANEVEDDEIA
jgi:hypothetical protein